MIKRITITLDENIIAKIRSIQAEKIAKTNRSISFSQVVEQILREGLKNRPAESSNGEEITFGL